MGHRDRAARPCSRGQGGFHGGPLGHQPYLRRRARKRISRHCLGRQGRGEDWRELLRSGKVDVFGGDAGVGYPAAEALPGAKIVPGAFAKVRVAAALPKDRSAAAQAALATLVDEAKQSGIVQKAIDAKGLKGVNVPSK